ncbi:hypothetical protein NLJ89_g7181 [Agrocybe chaxingu]|uniref:Uncharacterized protein n=1 Tax=Agrocybe chaxingu TaxID=84603 RepID=A0A9W8JWV3_9AGAR|nr:hypothetical protein NLJ89_g7181 [Agrocybe chaxingu]
MAHPAGGLPPQWHVVKDFQFEDADALSTMSVSVDGGMLAISDASRAVQIVETKDFSTATKVAIPTLAELKGAFWSDATPRRRLLVVDRQGLVIVLQFGESAEEDPRTHTAYSISLVTANQEIDFTAIDHLGTELAVVCGRFLSVVGHPFHRPFSYASRTLIPPIGHPDLDVFRTEMPISLTYLETGLVLIGYTIGALVMTTTYPHIVVKCIIFVGGARSIFTVAVPPSELKTKMVTLNRRGGYNVHEAPNSHLPFYLRGFERTMQATIPSITIPDGRLFNHFTAVAFLPDEKDTLVFGASNSQVLIDPAGSPQLLRLPGLTEIPSVHTLVSTRVDGKIIIIAAKGDGVETSFHVITEGALLEHDDADESVNDQADGEIEQIQRGPQVKGDTDDDSQDKTPLRRHLRFSALFYLLPILVGIILPGALFAWWKPLTEAQLDLGSLAAPPRTWNVFLKMRCSVFTLIP